MYKLDLTGAAHAHLFNGVMPTLSEAPLQGKSRMGDIKSEVSVLQAMHARKVCKKFEFQQNKVRIVHWLSGISITFSKSHYHNDDR